MKPKISIIIPVYGVEKYIAKCIESIKAQSFKDFEAILVNDGTKDHSIDFAETVIAGDERFIILHKENGGQGSARNLGLDHARGDYITFIDSDDYVEPDFLQAMYEKIVREKADICTCNVNLLFANGKLDNIFRNNPKNFKISNDYLNAYFYISNWMWDKLFKKEVFNGMRFDPSVRTFEDAHFVFRLVYNKKITSVNSFLYNYVQHKGSTSNDVKPSYINDRMAVFTTQKNFFNEILGKDKSYLEYVYLKTFVFFCVSTLARYSKKYSSDIKSLKDVLDCEFFNLKTIGKVFLKDRKVGLSLLVFKLSPSIFRVLVKFWFRKKTV